MDHAKAIKDIAKSSIDVYASPGTLRVMDLHGHRYHEMRPGEEVRIGSWGVLPFKAIHNAKEPLGWLLVSGLRNEKALYICDSLYVPHRFRGLNIIAIEVNYQLEILRQNIKRGSVDISLGKKIVRNHMSLDTAKGFFKANDMSQVREIHLLHLSHANSDADLFKREIQKITGRPVYIGG